MTLDPTRHPTDGATFLARLPDRGALLTAVVPLLLIALVVSARMVSAGTRPTLLAAGAAADLPAAELAVAAADELERASEPAGLGFTFEIVQRATIHARDGGPPLEIPDSLVKGATIEVSEVPAGTYLERGSVTPAGFYAEVRRGTDDPTARLVWDGVEMEMATLVRGDETFRNDGDGWYATTRPPGIGLDPATVRLLPTMLRALEGTADKPAGPAPSPEGTATPVPTSADEKLQAARELTGTTRVDDIPGIIAVDLADATELLAPAELGFDETGRLISLRILARNTNLAEHDLVVDTLITFAYPDRVPELPQPEPAYVEPTPAPDEGE